MKTLIQYAICALFLSISIAPAQAQLLDSLPSPGVIVEMTPYDLKAFFTEADLLATPALQELDNNFNLFSLDLKIRSQVAAKVTSKSKQSPVRVKSSLVLEHDGNCFQIGCVKNGNCDKCGMLWWDRNGDGKVQPKSELRCVCKETKTQCQMRGRKTNC